MTHTYSVTGMSCTGCQAKVQQLLSGVNGVEKVSVDLPNGEAVIDMKEHIPTDQLKSALKDYPKYQLNEKNNSHNGKPYTYTKIKSSVVNHAREHGGGKYYCPMHCEGSKTYDKAGSCRVCGMNLEKIHSVSVKEKQYT